jgi:predicted nucleic acid-binding protein
VSVAFVDTNVLVAAASANDSDHERGRAIVEGIDAGGLPVTRISNYVIAEVLNYIHSRGHNGGAIEFYDRLSRAGRFEIVHATKQDYLDAIDVFDELDRLSFVDATIVSYMRREGLTFLYSFDADFDGVAGITRVNVAEDPFA